MRRKRSGFVSLILVLMIGAMLARAGNAPADPSEEVVKYLDTTIDWYRRVISFIQSPVNTDEVLFHDAVGLHVRACRGRSSRRHTKGSTGGVPHDED